jgi:hypothetical protein
MRTAHSGKAAAAAFFIAVLAALLAPRPVGGQTDADETGQPKLTYSFEGRILTALNEDGKEKWSHRFKSDIVKVTLEDDYLFVITKKNVVLLTPLSGIERWTFKADNIKKLEVRKPRVLASGDRLIAAIDIIDGSVDWRFRTSGDIESYVIHDDRFMVVKTEKRVVALDYGNGKTLVSTSLSRTDEYLKSQALGPVLVLHFKDKIRLWNTDRKRELPEIKRQKVEDMRGEELPKALGYLRDRVTSRKENDRVAGMVSLLFMKNKDGALLVRVGLDAEDDAAKSAAREIMRAMAEYSRESGFLGRATEGVLEEITAADTSGEIERAFYSAYYEKYSYELPEPESVLKVMIVMLNFADRDGKDRAIKSLEQLTGKTFDYKPTDSLKERNQAVGKWEKWLDAHRGGFAWDIPGRKIKIRE